MMDTGFKFVAGVALGSESMSRLRQWLQYHRGAARDGEPQHQLLGARLVGGHRVPR